MRWRRRRDGLKSWEPAEPPVVIAEGMEVGGKLVLSRPAILNGAISGHVTATESLVVGEHATVNADISAASVVVRGIVFGSITASREIELAPSAMVRGTIQAPSIVIHPGAYFEGACHMVPGRQTGAGTGIH